MKGFISINCYVVSNATLKVEAAIAYLTGEHRSLIRRTFYLLDRSISDIIKGNVDAIWGDLLSKMDSGAIGADAIPANNIKLFLHGCDPAPDFAPGLDKYSTALEYTAITASGNTPLVSASYAKAVAILKTSAVRSFTTDTLGKADLRDLSAGTYYICDFGEMCKGSRFWDVQINLGNG